MSEHCSAFEHDCCEEATSLRAENETLRKSRDMATATQAKTINELRAEVEGMRKGLEKCEGLLSRQRDADDHYMSGECDICDDLDKTEDCPVMEKLTPKRYEIDAALALRPVGSGEGPAK